MVDQLVTKRMAVWVSSTRSQKLKRTRSAKASIWEFSKMTNCWLVGDSRKKVQPASLRMRRSSAAASMAVRPSSP